MFNWVNNFKIMLISTSCHLVKQTIFYVQLLTKIQNCEKLGMSEGGRVDEMGGLVAILKQTFSK